MEEMENVNQRIRFMRKTNAQIWFYRLVISKYEGTENSHII